MSRILEKVDDSDYSDWYDVLVTYSDQDRGYDIIQAVAARYFVNDPKSRDYVIYEYDDTFADGRLLRYDAETLEVAESRDSGNTWGLVRLEFVNDGFNKPGDDLDIKWGNF